jgi:thiol-disulfide isomerase/thioredoxin
MVNYYRPIQVSLSPKRPEGIDAEPKYHSKKPLYGVVQMGTGQIVLVVDEAEGETPLIYIDRNNDHDLTNDGSGKWTNVSDSMLSLSNVVIQAPYGTTTVPYTLEFYRFRTRLQDCVLCYRNCCREGEITSRGRRYKIAVLNETADGRFDNLANGTLLIDLNQDGRIEGETDSAEWHELAQPFNIHGKVWEAVSMSPDGLRLTIRPSNAKVAMKPYLNPGCPAPQFTGSGLDNRLIDLATNDAKTRYILLDFWASWCGPCRGEFPTMKRLSTRYKGRGLRIVGINLDEDRKLALKAVKEGALNYCHVFDGKGWQNAVAVLYRVHGIPQTYLLDKDLNIVAVGLRGETLERRLSELLVQTVDEAAATTD